MNMTSAVETSIHAVSPLSMAGGAGAGGSSARRLVADRSKTATARGKIRRLTKYLRAGVRSAHQNRGEEANAGRKGKSDAVSPTRCQTCRNAFHRNRIVR